MNAKFLMSCAAVGLGGLAAATEGEARTSSLDPLAETGPAAVTSIAAPQPSLQPDLLIGQGKIAGITLTEHELVRGVKVALTKYGR